MVQSLPNDIICLTKLRAFADDKLTLTRLQKLCFFCRNRKIKAESRKSKSRVRIIQLKPMT